MKDFRNSFLKWGVLISIFLIPILCFKALVFPHVTSKAYFFYGSVEIIVAVWVYSAIVDPSYRLNKTQCKWLIPFAAYTCWLTVTALFAFNPHLAIWSSLIRGTGLLTMWHGFAFVLVLMSLIQRYGKSFAYTLMKWSVAAGAVVGGSIWLGDEGFKAPIAVLQRGSGGGVIGNSSLAAAYLLFVVAFAIILLVSKEVRTKWWIFVSAFVILFSPIFINIIGLFNGTGIWGSARAATASIGIGIVITVLVLMVFSHTPIKRTLGWIGIVAGVVVFCVVWGKLMTPGTIVHDKFLAATSEARFIFWGISQKAIDERPFIGYGPENFPIAVQRHFDPELLSKESGFEAWADRAHNIYYDTGVSGGYPAVALYALLLGSVIFAAYQGYKRKVYSNKEAAIFIGLIVAYVIQNLTVFDGFMSLFVLYIVLAMLYGRFEDVGVSSKTGGQQKRPLLATILILLVGWGVYSFSILPIQKAYRFGSVIGDAINKRPDRYMSLLKGTAVGNDWDVSGFAHDEYKLYATDPMKIKNNAKVLPYAQKDIQAFIAYAEKVAEKNKTDYRLYLSIVHLYSTSIFLNDTPYNPITAEKIESYIAYGRTLTPSDPQLYWAEAQIAAWKGDLKGVVTAYQAGIGLDPKLKPSYTLLVGFLKDIGDQRGYREALAQAQKAIPGFSLQ